MVWLGAERSIASYMTIQYSVALHGPVRKEIGKRERVKAWNRKSRSEKRKSRKDVKISGTVRV